MKHHFVRLFLSIVLISLVVILVQCLILFIGNWYVARSWKDMVFEDFITSLRSSIGSIDDAEDSSVVSMMVQRTSERISGLLLRDDSGRYILSLGASPAGEQMPSPEARRSLAVPELAQSRLKLSYQSSISYVDTEIPAARYAFNVETLPGTLVIASVKVEEDRSSHDMLVSLPSIVADQDIAGTVRIVLNGETAGYIDVLVYRMDYYQPTLFATRAILASFLLSLPVALIISALLAAIVSKWNEKSVKEIQQSLTSLSQGYYDINLPEQNTEEMAEIADSITALGKDLSRHQKSRKEWIRNISHDLNTPVTSLNILINGALDGVFPLDRKLLLDMQKENDCLMQRIRSVAYYSYLLSPDARVEKTALSARDSIMDALQACGMDCSVSGEDAVLAADPRLLQRALTELLDNASAYSDGGSLPSASVSVSDDAVMICISNSGHLPDPLPQFFEPWARGDASRTEGGSGLGLPIVYQIMELHGGSVVIGERDGTVSVTLSFPRQGTSSESHQ